MKPSIFERLYYKIRHLFFFCRSKWRINKINNLRKKHRDRILKTHPIAYWPLDEGDKADVAIDLVGKHNGVYVKSWSDELPPSGSGWVFLSKVVVTSEKDHPFTGEVDKVRMHNHPLTPEEIVKRYEDDKKSNE